MSGWKLFTSAWEWHPSVVAGCALLLGGYLAAVRCRINRCTLFFAAGVIATLLALVSPLDPLGDDYLFSAHMLQHILLDMVAPPLFILGLPAEPMRRLLRWPPLSAVERVLGQPVLAWWLGTGTLCVWHLPVLFNAALASEGVHIFQHLTFLVTGTIMWWPVFGPLEERRMTPMTSVVYLLLASVPNAILGIFFTFAGTSFYAAYAQPEDELGALALIRDSWGLDPVTDQQLGGAIMWVLGSIIYFWAILAAVARWFLEPGTEEEWPPESLMKAPGDGAGQSRGSGKLNSKGM